MFEFQPSSKIKAAIQIHFRNETKGKIHLPSHVTENGPGRCGHWTRSTSSRESYPDTKGLPNKLNYIDVLLIFI